VLTPEQNERLCRVGPGTPCGELMRRYWQPIAASSQLAEPGTLPIRILGEDLILYRDRDGGMGLLDPQCAHRRAGLGFGIPEKAGLRCTYHGWLYDAAGQCIEQPYESFVDEGSNFASRIRIKAYPVEELGGLVFAYLGPEPRPLLPRWEALIREDLKREIGTALIPCNWLQTLENAGDSSHVVYTHYMYSRFVLDRLGRPDLQRHSASTGAEGFRAVHTGENRSAFGHGAVVFPNMDVQYDCYQIRVPVDDTHTLHIWYMFYPPGDQAELGLDALPAQEDPGAIPFFEVPVPRLDWWTPPPWGMLDNNSGQDVALWHTQGAIMDRSQEHLGRGDENIIRLRQQLEEQIGIVEEGGDPMNTFRDPAENQYLTPPWGSKRPNRAPDGRPDRTQAARKYSSLISWATVQSLGPDALDEPVH
jgi:5,5'-dehydrodivanillate O-demethylase oxygenase subunit